MQIKSTFILLITAYAISVVSNSLKSNGTVGHFALPMILMVLVFLIYAALSVFLTIKINKTGAFDWISANQSIRNIALIIGLIGMLYTLFYAIMIKMDWATYQNQSISRPQDFLAFTAYIWVPLLMIIPYGLWLFKSDSMPNPGLIFKVPIIVNVLIGLATYMYFNSWTVREILTPKQNNEEHYIQQTISEINKAQRVIDILYYTRPSNDKRIVNAAFAKMNSFKGWQQKFEELLQECHDMKSITEVYHYLSTNLIENPETMVAPFERSLECIVTYVQKLTDDPYVTPNDLDVLDIDKMLGTIERQFPDHFIQLDKPLGFLSKTLADVKRTEMKGKAEEWVKTIESFRKKFSEKDN